MDEMFQIVSNTLFQIKDTVGFNEPADLWGPNHQKKIKLGETKGGSSGGKKKGKGGKRKK